MVDLNKLMELADGDMEKFKTLVAALEDDNGGDEDEDEAGDETGEESEDEDQEEEQEDEELDWSDIDAVKAHVASLEQELRVATATKGLLLPDDITDEQIQENIFVHPTTGEARYVGPTKESKTGKSTTPTKRRNSPAPGKAGRNTKNKSKEATREELLAQDTFPANGAKKE